MEEPKREGVPDLEEWFHPRAQVLMNAVRVGEHVYGGLFHVPCTGAHALVEALFFREENEK